MKKSRLIELLNEIDEKHTYMDGGHGMINAVFPSRDTRTPWSLPFRNEVMLNEFDYLRETLFQRTGSAAPICIGDFIRVTGLSYSGIVTGEGTLTTRNWPAWKVRGPRGEISAILKSQAEFVAPDRERTISEH